MSFVKKRSIIFESTNPIKGSIHIDSYSKKLSRKELEMDLRIKNLANEIKQKLTEGKKPEDISIVDKTDINDLISFILDKSALYMNYLSILKQFLYSFNFLEIFSLPESFIDKNDLYNKIAMSFRKEQAIKNKIIYLNGQLGKKFYIILEGKVTIIEPVSLYVKATYQQFYDYMEFLLLNNEYELIRLCFHSNPKYVNEKIKIFKDKFYKFNELLDRNLNSDYKPEIIDENTYVDKFNISISRIFGEDSILSDIQKEKFEKKLSKEEEEERKEKEKEEEEEKSIDDDPNRRITGNDAENDRYEIVDKIRLKKRESILNFYAKRKHKKILDKPKIFKIWKYNNKRNTILKNGDTFGEVALKKNDNKIKSTIIAKSDCLFCYLERDEYRNLINEFTENSRRINVDSLMHSKLFYNYNSDLFSIHYYNFFTPIKKAKGEFIFRQKEFRKYIYFIKSGGVQIEFYSTYIELGKILDILTERNEKIKKAFNDIVIPHESFESFTQKKQKFNIFVYFNGEIAGTNEILYPDTDIFMFNAICTSDCEIFSLDIESLKNIINEKLIRKNYNELNIIKKEKLIKRLLSLKTNIIYQYNRKVISENEEKTTEKTVKKNNSILFDKSRNKLTLKTNNLLSSTEIKREINNYSPERRNKNKELQSYKSKYSEPLSFRSSRKFSNNISVFNSSHKKFRLLESTKTSTEHLKTEKLEVKKTPRRKISINFSLKGKVPKLLLIKANTFNKVLDQLILKEKDFFNVNNSNYSKTNSKHFINHLDILSFDNYVNKIETNLKINKEENSKTKHNKIKKLILTPVSLKNGKNIKFTSERKTNFRKDSIL